MLKLILLFITLLLGLIFSILPNSYADPKVGFLFSDEKIYYSTWVYFAFEHFIFIILSYIIYAESLKYRLALFTFLVISVADFIDYVLTYNEIWYKIGPIPVSMNTLSVVIFALAILKSYQDER